MIRKIRKFKRAECILIESLLFLWQLPQNIIGLLLVIITRGWYIKGLYTYRGIRIGAVYHTFNIINISMGMFIILGMDSYDYNTEMDNRMFNILSLFTGPLYLIIAPFFI